MSIETLANSAARPHSDALICNQLPKTFDTWLERHRIATLAFQAVADVSCVDAEPDSCRMPSPSMPSEKMMVLITYCYATGVFDSAEIAASVPRDAILRDICAGLRPTADSVRQFRFAHSRGIIRALSQVLRKASAW
ncbi:MAG TPA: hypothetical protein VN281_11770 [Verrucomicrobiae bacterium]|jgi:hypothetical protein|nr:hypothetical protein [Verrucomicrobiae bacterium]